MKELKLVHNYNQRKIYTKPITRYFFIKLHNYMRDAIDQNNPQNMIETLCNTLKPHFFPMLEKSEF